MEILLKAIATYLLGKLCKFIESAIHQKSVAEKGCDIPQALPEDREESHGCPLLPIIPRRDYLEAMIGDFLEWQSELRQEGVPNYRIILLTLWQIYHLLLDVIEITVHNLIVPDQSRSPKHPPKASVLDGDSEVSDDADDRPQI